MPHDLTPRQIEVVRLISLGCSNSEIARILAIAPKTVDAHRVTAMCKLGAGNMALVTRWAIQHRITSLKDTLTPAEKRKRGRKKDGWN